MKIGNRLKKLRKMDVTKEEIKADFIFFMVSSIVSFLVVYLFDIHRSFYPGETIFPPSVVIFKSIWPYVIGTLLGGTIGFFLIKILLLGVKEELDET